MIKRILAALAALAVLVIFLYIFVLQRGAFLW